MSGRLRILWAAIIILAAVSPAIARLVHVDADYHPPGADISDVFPGMKLTALGSWPELDGQVYSREVPDPALATTGANVFGHNATGVDVHGRPRNETWIYPHTLLAIEFYDLADFVALDIIGDESVDKAAVDVYNTDSVIIEWAITPQLSYGSTARVKITRDAFDISYVVVSGIGGSAVRIDNIEANVIPEPATLLLLALGGLILTSRRSP